MQAKRFSLYARTISHLQPKQIGYLVIRRVLPRGYNLKEKVPAAQMRPGAALRTAPLTSTMQATGGGGYGEFRFLNVSKARGHGGVDWASPEMTKPWRYNLHYFDYIVYIWR